MNCCGNKRKEWAKEVKSSMLQTTNNTSNTYPVIKDKPDRVFEYTGNYSLTVIGVTSGKSYHFKFKGNKIIVAYNDSFAMMAERDLKIIIPPEATSKV
jgi:1,4-alpha-glucan branching enzyme